MRVLGFVLFVFGLTDLTHMWWVSMIGFFMFEFTGVTWLAATTSHKSFHGSDNNDHGPMN